MPNPENLKPWPKGVSGNPGGRSKKPDIDSLNKLIDEMGAESAISKAWLTEALGTKETIIETEHPDGTITRKIKRVRVPVNVPLLKMLVEYRNGKVPDRIINETDADNKPPPRIDVPDRDRRKDRHKAKGSDPGKGDTS